VRQYLAAYFFPRTADGRPNRAAIETALRGMEKHFGVLDRAVTKTGHLVGDSFTLADMNLLPILFFMEKAPESRAMLSRSANLKAYAERHMARASLKDTVPPPFPGRSSWEVEA
jgi:glutathione S-transferase